MNVLTQSSISSSAHTTAHAWPSVTTRLWVAYAAVVGGALLFTALPWITRSDLLLQVWRVLRILCAMAAVAVILLIASDWLPDSAKQDGASRSTGA